MILITPLVVDGSPSEAANPRPSTTSPTPRRPTIQPTRKEILLAVADRENSIKMTAMIGTGLIATPTANPRISPIAAPMW